MGLRVQVHPVHRGWLGDRWDRLFDPAVNLAVAWDIYVAAGHSFRPWSCS